MIISPNPLVDLSDIQATTMPEYIGLTYQMLETKNLLAFFPNDPTLKGPIATLLSEYGDVELKVISTSCAVKADKTINSSLISIIIPTYNSALFIEATLQSVEKQDYSPFEILIVDDGSNDGTQDIIMKFLSKRQNTLRARFVGLSHIGNPAAIRNFALHNLISQQCSFVTFLDSDDIYVGPEVLKKLAIPLIKSIKYTSSYGGYDIVTEQGERLAGPKMLSQTKTGTWVWRKQFKLTWPNIARKRIGTFHFQSLMVRLPSPVIPYIRLGEDGGYFARIIRRTAEACGGELNGIFHVPEIIFHYRKRSSSISVDATSKRLKHPVKGRSCSSRNIPYFYTKCGIPEKYITRSNVAVFVARQWLPRIYNPLFRRRFRDAVGILKRAHKDPSFSVFYFSLVFIKDLITNPMLRDILSYKLRKAL